MGHLSAEIISPKMYMTEKLFVCLIHPPVVGKLTLDQNTLPIVPSGANREQLMVENLKVNRNFWQHECHCYSAIFINNNHSNRNTQISREIWVYTFFPQSFSSLGGQLMLVKLCPVVV